MENMGKMSGKGVVIDGATSMLGIALIRECIERDVKVLAVVRENSSRMDRIPSSDLITILPCSQEHIHDLKLNFSQKYDCYYHFAWGNTEHAGREKAELQQENISYTLDAVHLASKLGCKRFIGAGSQAEYGRVNGSIGPETPVHPENAYGVSKYAAGQLSRILCDQLKMEWIWTRTFSVYGIGDTMQTLVMYTIRELLKGEKPSFTKAEQQWDYLFSRDAGRAFYLIGERGVPGKIYCIGSGQVKELREYIFEIRDAIDPKLPLGIGDREYADKQVMHLQADITSLKEDTGFEISYNFSEGIRETVAWVKQQETVI